jgi:hypothetical protein
MTGEETARVSDGVLKTDFPSGGRYNPTASGCNLRPADSVGFPAPYP